MISIAIPTAKMPDGEHLFARCLESLWNQSFQDFEVVVTDNCDDDSIESICRHYKTGIRYHRNPVKGMAQNTNEAIRRSKGDLVKILYMDDFMFHDRALERIIEHFRGQWLVTGCNHTRTDALGTIPVRNREYYYPHVPCYSDDINTGHNTIGSPSVLTIKNEHPIFFDENMTWMLDCDYYYRLYQKYGDPAILKDVNVTIGLHDGQATNTMGSQVKENEYHYLINKYK